MRWLVLAIGCTLWMISAVSGGLPGAVAGVLFVIPAFIVFRRADT